METGLITLAAFNAVIFLLIIIWGICKYCPFYMPEDWSFYGDSDEENPSGSDSPSPPAFDRTKKPSSSILKNNNQDDRMDEVFDVDSDPFVQAHRKLNHDAAIKLNEKRTRFEEPPLF